MTPKRKMQRSHRRRLPHPLIAVAVAIFLCLMYTSFNLMIQSSTLHSESTIEFDNAPIPRSSPPTEAGLQSLRTNTSNRIYPTNASDSANEKYKRGATVDVQQLAESLTKVFSAKDGIPSNERMGFGVTLSDPRPATNEPDDKPSCFCDVVSTDCLHTIACLPDIHNPQKRHALAWLGVQIRRAIKATSVLDNDFVPERDFAELPLGKLLQYHTIEVWKDWRHLNILPKNYDHRGRTVFVDERMYPDCMILNSKLKHSVPRYNGISCFYMGPGEPEDSSGTTIEDEANRWYNATKVETGTVIKQKVDAILQEFLRKNHPPDTNEWDYDRNIDLFTTDEHDAHFSARGNLMMFAHIMRIMFNRRSFLDTIYREKVTHVTTPGSENWASEYDEDPFIVSVHIRRGDSCGLEKNDTMRHRREASDLDSKAQTGGDRLCYRTEVYLNAIRRIRTLVPKTRPLHAYLSTDDVGDIIDEVLKKKNGQKKVNIGVDQWHFLNYSRSIFDYKADVIEAEENTEAQPMLGETAVADLWHLSHGHAFVGHLGSRFGKASWLLATARRNDFIPFFSVDGHSFCCEIDESCGETKPYITVENCLSFGHDYGNHDHENYFEHGSVVRKKVFLKLQEEKKREERSIKSRLR